MEPVKPPTNSDTNNARTIWLTAATFLGVLLAFIVYVYYEKEIDRANDQRHQSLLLADQLRQSSDDLTRMARSFVVTGDPIFKSYYQEILNIRDGRHQAPDGYLYPYWDLVLGKVLAHRSNSGPGTPLQEMIRQSGFIEAELAKLTLAKANSDALTSIEIEAMRLVEQGGTQAQRDRAIESLYDRRYQLTKAAIMAPIKDAFVMMDLRTAKKVADAARVAVWARILVVLVATLAIAMLWRSYQGLRRTLGTSAQNIHEYLQRIGREETLTPLVVPRGMQDSILAGLSVMQDRIHASEAERIRAVAELRVSEARLSSIFDSTPDAILISDELGVITMVNQQVELLLGYTTDELLGKSIETLVPERARHNHPALRGKFAASHTARRMGGGLAIKARCKDGSECDVEVSLSRVQTESGLFFASSLRDISERKIAEQRINELAFFDQLTGLPNRTLLLDRLGQSMTSSVRSNNFGAVLFIDLDNFKTINDTLGHDMGDALLKQVAQRLTACVRAEDTVARLGGDEFVAVLASLSMSQTDAAAQVEAVGDKIVQALNAPYQLRDVACLCSASLGVTMFKGNAAKLDDLLKQADMAMYKSKAAGRNTLRFFDPKMETDVMERAAMESDLREALRQQHFVLHYQPQVVGEGRLTGAEALVRWQHPQRGLVPPGEFIALAEETALILPLGQWVLQTACAQLALWANQPGMAHLYVAVNISADQLHQADFVNQVLAALDSTGANPQRLKLELTESLLVSDVDNIIVKMAALKARGVGFSLDDFGTGYSSLSSLKRLPLDQLKIDQAFVRDILSDPNDAAIAKMVIALAESMGLAVIAEGVEIEAQRVFLERLGCHAYQGYLFSKPIPIAEFEEFARRI